MGKIGLAFVNPAPLTKPEYVINFAKKCEAMAVHSLWIIDRVAYDNLEPLTVLVSGWRNGENTPGDLRPSAGAPPPDAAR